MRLPCEVDVASEFRYRDPVLDRDTLVIAISQSGETADILRAVEHAREQKARVLAITNTVGSTLARDSDAVLYTRAGPEVGVASTKTFLATVAATYLVALWLAELRGCPAARRGGDGRPSAGGDPRRHPAGHRPHRAGARARQGARRGRCQARCCSSGGTSPIRWRSRARSR